MHTRNPMKEFTCSIPATKNVGDILTTLKSKVKGFSGSEVHGCFNDSGIVGYYEIKGNEIIVTLTKKPFYVTWAYVEKELRSFICE